MDDFEKEFYQRLTNDIDTSLLSGFATTSAAEPTATLTKDDWLKLVEDFHNKYPKMLDGIYVTTYDVLPTNTEIYEMETLDHKKYMLMHSDVWEKLLETPGIVKEWLGYPTMYGIPVKLNDPELIKIWMDIVERNYNKVVSHGA